MKKIQLSTVEQTAQVQVINVNSYLVAKSVRVMLSMKHAIAGTRTPMTLCTTMYCHSSKNCAKLLRKPSNKSGLGPKAQSAYAPKPNTNTAKLKLNLC